MDHLQGGWTGEDLRLDRGWIMQWSEDELQGLDAALAACARRNRAWQEVEREDFPLNPPLQAKLERIARALEEGRGLVKIKGLPLERYDDEQIRLLWFALARHLGRPVFQDSRGQLMREIKNEGGDLGARHGRIAAAETGGEFLSSKARTYGPEELRFHTDRCDVVGLLCLGQAKGGGLSRIASTIAVHNAILDRRPDLLELLYRPYPRSRLGEEEGTYIEAAQLQAGAEKMSPDQWEAIDLLAAIAAELSYAMRLAPGDIQLLNSHVTYHARDAFKDAPGEGLVRRLLRVWLAMPNSRALPEDHRILWRQVDAGAVRGGIGQEPVA
jgi:hypothetical protein